MSTHRQTQPVHSFSVKRGCSKKTRLPQIHSVMPNQYATSVPKGDVKNKNTAPTTTQRQAQPVHNFSARRGCWKKQRPPWVHSITPNQYTTSVPKEDVNKNERLPWIHSVMPNQYTTSGPKEDVEKSTKAPMSTQRQALTSTQLQCQKRMFKNKRRPPWVHSVKPNQYTPSVPKEDV